ncbi:hypothetical protein ACOME3_002676 [Neoechinorhynchus agilis]
MALVTIQRTSVLSLPPLDDASRAPSASMLAASDNIWKRCRRVQSIITESYFVVRGAALILRKKDCYLSKHQSSHLRSADDMREHLEAMFNLIHPMDTVSLAVRVESSTASHVRYALIINRVDRLDTEEAGVLGIDIVNGRASVGLIMPVFADLNIKLSGDGGLKLFSNDEQHSIKPVTVQAMWSAFQNLNRASGQARLYNYYPNGISHTWLHVYRSPHLTSDQVFVNEWNILEDVLYHRQESLSHYIDCDELHKNGLLDTIRHRLREIMTTVDLDDVTSKYLRERLEQELDQDLSRYGKFIDDVILQVFAHLDAASQIEPWLYLGSEWNASNYEELKARNVGYILNVSREIDNFYPADFVYLNIRVRDDEQTELIREWNKTFRFIKDARSHGMSCLVHCKMGISRSAATVIAFLMKENEMNLNVALNHVCRILFLLAGPNDGFMDQLKVYEGILLANRVSRFLFPDYRSGIHFHTYFDWSARLGLEDTFDRFSQKVNQIEPLSADHENESIDGAQYVFKRFMNSLFDDQQIQSTASTLPSNEEGPVVGRRTLVPRVTKPDSFWIRSCRSTERTMSDSDISGHNSVGPANSKSVIRYSGEVRRRVNDLEARTRDGSDSQRDEGGISAVSCVELNSINRIQSLVKLYSNEERSERRLETSAMAAR